MTFVSGKVVDGRIVVEGVELPEGSQAMIWLADDGLDAELTPEQEAKLLSSIAQAERGEFVDGWELLQQLGPKT